MIKKVNKTDKTRFLPKNIVHKSFILVTIISILLFIVSYNRIGRLTSSSAISAALIIVFWFVAQKRIDARALIGAHAVILANGLGAALNLFSWQFAGVTYDTYLHLLGGFAAALVLLNWEGNGWKTLGYVLILGFLLEVVEVIEIVAILKFTSWPVLGENAQGFANTCWNSFCTYWQDTLKDMLNDALGAIFALLASGSLSLGRYGFLKHAR